jgi:hypothetical protein
VAQGSKAYSAKGSENAQDIYVSVGVALSWWEASEDMLMGLFRILCKDREPTVFELYVGSPRGRRNEMLKAAIKRHQSRFQVDEINQIKAAIKALDRLASIRNEIAHGHCADVNNKVDEQTVMKGYYLLPSLNEGFWHERSPRFAHTIESINEFTAAVRHHRGIVMDIQFAILERESEAWMKLSGETRIVMQLARDVADGLIPPEGVLLNLRRAK